MEENTQKSLKERIKSFSFKEYYKSINIWFYLGMIALAIALFLVDYFTKNWAYYRFESGIVPNGDTAYYSGNSITGIPGLIDFTLVFNNGAAWNWLRDQKWILVTISTIATCALTFNLLFRFNKYPKTLMVGIAFMLPGAAGNLVDRVGYMLGKGIYRYGVVDFLQFSFWKSFPVCNVADYALTIGVIILIIGFIFYYRQLAKEEEAETAKAQAQFDSINDEDAFVNKLAMKEKENQSQETLTENESSTTPKEENEDGRNEIHRQ